MKISPEDIVEGLYMAAFDRQADPTGLRYFSDALRSGAMDVSGIARTLVKSEERQKPSKIIYDDHSQFGEYKLLIANLLGSPNRSRIVVDVGANGKERSNSYDLMRDFGWRGVLIEANPELYDHIAQDFSGLDFTLVKTAIDVVEGKRDLHLGVNQDVSSLKATNTASWGEIRQILPVDTRRLSNVLVDNAIPINFDVLSIDVEGVDTAILNDLISTSSFRPRIVVIEASVEFSVKSLLDTDLCQAVRDCYELAGQTLANLILRHMEF